MGNNIDFKILNRIYLFFDSFTWTSCDTGYPTVLLKPFNCYTSVIEKLITYPEFGVIHLEVLLLQKCEALPNLKTGMAINKCSTACIKELSKLMIIKMEWKLVETLIEHGTVPDIKCIEIAIEQYGENRTLYLTHQVEKSNRNKICYDNLLSLAICKKWCGKFVDYCLKQGAKFSDKDTWTVLKWRKDSTKQILLKQIMSQDGAMNVQNNEGQLPLEFFLEQGMINDALALLKFSLDTSKIDIVKTIKGFQKYDVSEHLIKILNGIIKNKKNVPIPDLKHELNHALKYAFTNKQYKVALVLINHGADINSFVVDKSTTTAVHVATEIVLHLDGTYVRTYVYVLYVYVVTFIMCSYVLHKMLNMHACIVMNVFLSCFKNSLCYVVMQLSSHY